MPSEDFDVIGSVSLLIDAWCERREPAPLARLLPAWTSNNGLTDGWGEVWNALRTVRADCHLPDVEAETVDRAIAAVGRLVFRT